MTLPESTPSFQNIPPFSTTTTLPESYPTLPESTPPSQNIPPPLRYVTLPYSTHPSRIYPLLSHYMRHSHNLPHPPRIYPPPPLNIYMRHSRNPPSDIKYIPILNIYIRPSQNLPLPPRIGYPPFLTTICDTPTIHPSLPEYTPYYIKCGTQNITPLYRIYPHFLQLCHAPRIYPALRYATLPEIYPHL